MYLSKVTKYLYSTTATDILTIKTFKEFKELLFRKNNILHQNKALLSGREPKRPKQQRTNNIQNKS